MTKRRGRRRSRRARDQRRRATSPRDRDAELELALQRAERSIDRGRSEKAVELLEPFVGSAPDDSHFHHVLGYARLQTGDPWGAMSAFERAASLVDAGDVADPRHLFPLAGLYTQTGFRMHALQLFREMMDRGAPTPFLADVREAVDALEEDVAQIIRLVGRPAKDVERGLLDLEDGQRAMAQNDYPAAVAANRSAIKRLGDWPPPHNNLSLVLFYQGQVEEALEEVHGVLQDHPENLHALANGVRFLTWSRREKEARDLWARLREVTPQDADARLKKAEAAAVLGEHESVYRLLEPLEEAAAAEELSAGLLGNARYLLAVAAANTGRRKEAMRRLGELQRTDPAAAETLNALKAGQSGTGWSSHFRYFSLADMLPPRFVRELIDLLDQEDDMSPGRFRRRIERLAKRFPQIVHVGEKMIWEEQQPEAGINILSTIGTPEAHAALRRFGLSQAGSDDARLEALLALVVDGVIEEGEPVRVWIGGEWREVELGLEEIRGETMRQSDYAPEVIDLLNRAIYVYSQGNVEQAEELFEGVLELDPNVKEAYNNLGTIYSRRGEHQRAKEMLRRAIEIDPQYVFPLCNLANYRLDEERVEEAEELLARVSQVEGMLPQEISLYKFARARMLIVQERYEKAEQLLRDMLEVMPDYEPAQNLLAWIRTVGRVDGLFSSVMERARSYWERQQERDRAWRERLQRELRTSKPTLPEVLPLYTRAALTETAREVIPRGGWSTLRKAELIEAIIEALTDADNLARIVKNLDEEEREALRTVLERGGAMAWDAFDDRYGNDLDESRHWEHHKPETTMGRLRLHGLLAEATVDDALHVLVPVDLRDDLRDILSHGG